MQLSYRSIAPVLMLVLLGCHTTESSGSGAPPRDTETVTGWTYPKILEAEPLLYLTPETTAELIRGGWRDPWEPRVNPNVPRGGIYGDVGPAVVAVVTDTGHGTGFIISEDGLVLTNYHVIERGSFIDVERSISYVKLYLGKLIDGQMQRVKDPLRGEILAADPTRDLALLKLATIPEDLKPLPRVAMSKSGPQPGQICWIIGHPSSGVLWTIRQGVVAGRGRSPADIVDVVVRVLAARGNERREMEDRIQSLGSQNIVLSSCQANHGDSGGPLLDDNGALIGITYAVPSDLSDESFTYHIPLEDVQQFLEDESDRTPMLLTPDAYSLGPLIQLPRPEVIAGSFADDGKPQRLLFDVDRDTPQGLIKEENLVELIGHRRFDAEAAVQYEYDHGITFYDTDNDGTMDEILVYHDLERARYRYYLDAGRGWKVEENVKIPWLDTSRFTEPRLRKKLAKLLRELQLL